MDAPRSESQFLDTYDEIKSGLMRAYRSADHRVYRYAMDHNISVDKAWSLVAEEATERGDQAISSLAQNPLDDRTHEQRAVERQVLRLSGKGLHTVSNWLHRRRQTRPDDGPS